jgi:hypothetical protein
MGFLTVREIKTEAFGKKTKYILCPGQGTVCAPLVQAGPGEAGAPPVRCRIRGSETGAL